MREYFYRIDSRGRVIHDGTEISDEGFLNFFFERLRENDTGLHSGFSFVSPCGNEMNFVRPDLYPIVFSKRSGDRLFYAPGLSVPLDLNRMRYSEKLILHPAPIGTFGLLGAELVLEFGRDIEPWGPFLSYRIGRSPPAMSDSMFVIEPLERSAGTEHLEIIRSDPSVQCFGCGGANAVGLALPFVFDPRANTARSWFRPPAWMAGHPSWMHGGFISLLLDEVCAKVLRGLQRKGATVELNVAFRKPVPLGREIELLARLETIEGRRIRVQGSVLADGDVRAEAQALFVELLSA